MTVINYREELVDFEYNGRDEYNPTIKFFIHVWQRAECLQDAIDTFEDAFQSWAGDYNGKIHLQSAPWAIRARATRWRSKGIPLQHLRDKTPSHDKLAEFARCEAYKKQKRC